jgi:enoyl-CoA hydratase/carnithine racemase
LVERVVTPARLDAAVEDWVGAILESGPRAIRLQKELIREWEAMPVSDAIQAGIRMMGRAYETDEPRRMVGEARARLRERKKS